jgi:ribosomal protein S18 acetylase RimI-like enzyme
MLSEGHLGAFQVSPMHISRASPSWRALRAGDLPALAKVAGKVHPGFPEDDAVFAERLALAPAWCFALADEKTLFGYVLSHPWHNGPPPKLNTLLGVLPSPSPTAYIHDLALLPDARGAAHGRTIVRQLIAQAKSQNFTSLALVAVSGSAPFWESQGFRVFPSPAPLSSYGDDARYMRLPLEV